MTRDIDTIIDDIDRLVDDQLAAGPVDDYSVNRYDKCGHCGRDWHGVAITERVEQMRWSGYDEDYRVADDDSRVICPGSEFIGPVQDQVGSLLSWPQYHYVQWFDPRSIELRPVTLEFPRESREMRFSFDIRPAHVVPARDEVDPEDPHYVTVDDNDGRRSGYHVSRFTLDEWQTVGHISGDGPRVRYWDRNFNFIATEGRPPEQSEPAEPSPVRSDAGIPTARRRERQRLRTRARQQAEAATARQELLDRLRARIQETSR